MNFGLNQALTLAEAMNSAPLRGIEACVFDAYGTLFDFSAATRRCGAELGADADRLSILWRDKQLQYTWRLGLCCLFGIACAK